MSEEQELKIEDIENTKLGLSCFFWIAAPAFLGSLTMAVTGLVTGSTTLAVLSSGLAASMLVVLFFVIYGFSQENREMQVAKQQMAKKEAEN